MHYNDDIAYYPFWHEPEELSEEEEPEELGYYLDDWDSDFDFGDHYGNDD